MGYARYRLAQLMPMLRGSNTARRQAYITRAHTSRLWRLVTHAWQGELTRILADTRNTMHKAF